ncbi:MAG: peptidoglycan-binding protein [Candidatus Zambryskibacteria bacterium]|nr:peptidoglycan-binding protein [Candidatus Zambryskibacteria bacterium]
MKKLLTSSLVASLLLPGIAFAAYNDVTLTSSTSIQAEGQTINVDGDSNVVESLRVDDGSFTFTLDSNSEVTVKSASNKKLDHNGASAHVVSSICETGNSAIHFKGTADDISITVTPKNTTCPEGGGTGGSSSSSSGGGGDATTVALVPATASREAQIASILKAIAALQAQIAALTGGATAAPTAATGKVIFTSNLSLGSRGGSVKALQQFLNTHGFIIASTGPGSPGNETETFGSLTVQAVRKFQEQYNIAKPGVAGYGTVGPKTRAKINELSSGN